MWHKPSFSFVSSGCVGRRERGREPMKQGKGNPLIRVRGRKPKPHGQTCQNKTRSTSFLPFLGHPCFHRSFYASLTCSSLHSLVLGPRDNSRGPRTRDSPSLPSESLLSLCCVAFCCLLFLVLRPPLSPVPVPVPVCVCVPACCYPCRPLVPLLSRPSHTGLHTCSYLAMSAFTGTCVWVGWVGCLGDTCLCLVWVGWVRFGLIYVVVVMVVMYFLVISRTWIWVMVGVLVMFFIYVCVCASVCVSPSTNK